VRCVRHHTIQSTFAIAPQLNSPYAFPYMGLTSLYAANTNTVVILTSYFRSRGRVTCAGKASEHLTFASAPDSRAPLTIFLLSQAPESPT